MIVWFVKNFREMQNKKIENIPILIPGCPYIWLIKQEK